jgi:PAS domain S-box-containing protein
MEEQSIVENCKTKESKLKKVEQIANLGYFEWDIINDKLYCSDQVYRNIGLVPQVVVPSIEIALSFIHQEEVEMVKKMIFEPPLPGIAEAEFRAVKPDGSVVWLHTRTHTVFGKDGKLTARLGTVQDITKQKTLELELKELIMRLRRANELLHDRQFNLERAQKIAKLGHFEWDIVNKSFYWSDQQYRNFGYNPQEITPTLAFVRSRIHPDDVELVDAAVIKVQNEKFTEVEFRILKANGSEGWLYAWSSAIPDKPGGQVKIFGITQDHTEQKLSEERIKRAEKDLMLTNHLYSRSTYLNRLLVNDYPLEYVSKALSEFGIESKVPYCCYVIHLVDKMRYDLGITNDDVNITAAVIQTVLIWLAEKGLGWIWKCNNDIFLLVPMLEGHVESKQSQLEFSSQLADEIEQNFSFISTIIGISGVSSIPLNIREMYEKARRAAVVAASDSVTRIVHYDDIGLNEMAFQLIKDENICTLARNTIGRLNEYDQVRGGDLLLTLKYILEDENLKSVAQKLFIHPNTVIWRKKRIEAILGVSLDKLETKVLLMLQFKIWGLQK